ncbi:MAG: hypothetical protein HWE13_12120 [Gammaproteobacteria bacterium]|nr:hypothetical protein [Gammaproteobacteria bacterium]NVK88871.1 hypothetical protein [Gammaproteobacteria bacterium]
MKFVTFLIMVLLSPLVVADELCQGWEKKIEPDMQMAEAIFTHEAAKAANKALGELIETGRFDWFEPLNQQKIIYGYLLKTQAQKAIDLNGKQDIQSLREVQEFCRFLVEEAFYYD